MVRSCEWPRPRRDSLCPVLFAVLLAVALLRAGPVVAAGIVGTGTPGSCTEAALNAVARQVVLESRS